MPPGALPARLSATVFTSSSKLPPNFSRFSNNSRPIKVTFPGTFMSAKSPPQATAQCLSPPISEDSRPGVAQDFEENIEKVIYRCRFLAMFAVCGSLIGSFLCFIKGCVYVVNSFQQYFTNQAGQVVCLLLESIDVYLLGTVMLVFGMGLYELFISDLDVPRLQKKENVLFRSNLFGLFTLKERPKWLEIKSVGELKTKLGHVIVMLLLIGLIDKSKRAAITTATDLLCFSASVFLSSSCLYLLSKLNGPSETRVVG